MAMRLLLVEDNPGDARLVREMCREQGLPTDALIHVDSMSEAEACLAVHEVDLILLDLGLPDARGLDALRRTHAAAPRVPLVVLTGLDDEAIAVQALQQGAQDYLIKGQLETRGLMRALRYAIERKTMDAEIRALNAELEARVAQRTVALESANRELEAFSYSVSHDLRAPLRSIDGYSSILLRDQAGQLDAEALRLLGIVVRNVKQMGTLIDDLLAFSRVSRAALEHRPVDMAGLARSVADELRAADPEREIAFDVGPLADAPGDAALLRQVWVNLLGNAAKFSGPSENARVEVRSEQSDGECRYTVSDNGVGFNLAYADNLFAPFSRLHPAADFEGTGIGLAIVARIVGRHGGRVWAEGTPGTGAIFGFALPTRTEAP
jgi:signal transduction histidine kinase